MNNNNPNDWSTGLTQPTHTSFDIFSWFIARGNQARADGYPNICTNFASGMRFITDCYGWFYLANKADLCDQPIEKWIHGPVDRAIHAASKNSNGKVIFQDNIVALKPQVRRKAKPITDESLLLFLENVWTKTLPTRLTAEEERFAIKHLQWNDTSWQQTKANQAIDSDDRHTYYANDVGELDTYQPETKKEWAVGHGRMHRNIV